MKKWVWNWYGRKGEDGSWIVIDNRVDTTPGTKYTFVPVDTKLYLDANPNHKWTPLVAMKYSERFTVEEFRQLAVTITDRLNAMEVEKKLKGEA
jgi:hypothetical protein